MTIANASMIFLDHPMGLGPSVFVVLFLAVELGYRAAQSGAASATEAHREQVKATRDTLGVLLSLLLGFTLAMALPRYDLRKQLAIDEANAIGTTVLRAQLLSEPARTKIHDLLVNYVDQRVAFSRVGNGEQQLAPSTKRTGELQSELWKEANIVAGQNPNPVTALFISSLNDTIDMSEKRLSGVENRIPVSIWIMLLAISMLTCMTVGYSAGVRFWMVWIVSPLMISIVMWLIADLNSPRSGMIRTDVSSMLRLQHDLNQGTTFQPHSSK